MKENIGDSFCLFNENSYFSICENLFLEKVSMNDGIKSEKKIRDSVKIYKQTTYVVHD